MSLYVFKTKVNHYIKVQFNLRFWSEKVIHLQVHNI
jgi:hypothetical protein